MNKKTPFFAFHDVSYAYLQDGKPPLPVLSNIHFSLDKGECVALMGASGAGKSTLLHLAGLLTFPSEGRIELMGENCSTLSPLNRTLLRRKHIGFIHQFHHLLPEFSAQENVMIPLMIADRPKRTARQKARDILEKVGLKDRCTHRPSQLSGGEQQRVAIARALVKKPQLILADEPTGNLDEKTADTVFRLFIDLVREENCSLLMVTHNPNLATQMDRTLVLKNQRFS